MITIRTGGNGSYKSAYTAWFTILNALKSGRVVVTNLEGMQPLDVIEERLNIKFPSSSKLIRIFSRDEDGIKLWQHFFCWCPLNAQIVIDECQDIFSKNIGFDGKKIKYQPLEVFLPLLPNGYKKFFDSRHNSIDMSSLDACEVDDRNKAEYDENGKIIYPLTYNEGFMRHRKYNWDIDLLSPDWAQIDSSIKACAEQAFFHKNRDGFMFGKRKPYIYKHATNVSKPSLPSKKDPNLFTEKIPLEAHLLYKSTGTGNVTKSGGFNVLLKSPKFYFLILLILFCVGYLANGVIDLFFKDESQVSTVETVATSKSDPLQSVNEVNQTAENSSVLRGGGVNNSSSKQVFNSFVSVKDVLFFEGLEFAYISGFSRKISNDNKRTLDIIINVHTERGVFSVNNQYLKAVDVKYQMLDHCLVKLTKNNKSSILTCEPSKFEIDKSEEQLASSRTETMQNNSIFM